MNLDGRYYVSTFKELWLLRGRVGLSKNRLPYGFESGNVMSVVDIMITVG